MVEVVNLFRQADLPRDTEQFTTVRLSPAALGSDPD